MWQSDFLAYDYIGAVWPQYDDGHTVGNGGFSLRSRKLLDALASDDIVARNPEDVCIARTYRSLLEQRWGIRFADEKTAHRFSFERAPRLFASSFGFHGMSHLPEVLPPPALLQFAQSSPSELFASTEARGFIKKAIELGQAEAANLALQKRLRRNKWPAMSDLRLMARLWLRYRSKTYSEDGGITHDR